MNPLAAIILAWLLAGYGMGSTPCPGPTMCAEPPRPVKACFVKGEPCQP